MYHIYYTILYNIKYMERQHVTGPTTIIQEGSQSLEYTLRTQQRAVGLHH